ncbi:MAG: metallophosphoesterase [Treponema sp.]|nr:metallophosphoesterase [Treponema sp.]
MKILCVSDLIDPLIYTNSITQRYADVDIVLSAGDLPMDYLDFIISRLNKPLFFVMGNHHNSTQEKHAAINTDAKVCREPELIIAGLGGCMRHSRGKNQFSDFQVYLRILKLFPALFFNRLLRGRYLDILLTHAAPRGIHDREDKYHRGFKAFLWFMRVFKPRYLIHGHIHLYDLSGPRNTKYHNTHVINAFSHYIIDTAEYV